MSLPETIVIAPAVLGALLYWIKRLYTFDLELRAHSRASTR